jgi:putative radical SAM enzyme (TIGR03279 family)
LKLKNRGHKITAVAPGSIGEELELEPGDVLLTIDGEEIEDIFDYDYMTDSESFVMTIQKKNGEEWELEIESGGEDLGLTFENGLMSEYRSCRNKCIFCFIDQMPPGMRETLYFKDDDSRLSFLQGNYITLTNMSDRDIDRIIRFHLSPINISVQTMNPELRCRMLNNRFAGEALKKIDRLYEAGTEMNGQIVLCKGVNDGEELRYTIERLAAYAPHMQSVSVVPVGLSKFRDGLYPLEPFTKEDACQVIDLIEEWQKKLYEKHKLHFIHASDEWYILAERELPEESRYDGYIQLENGVGMIRLLYEEFMDALGEKEDDGKTEELSMATGFLPYPYLKRLLDRMAEVYPGRKIHLYPIRNDFFGEMITVAGLITGQDLVAQLKGKPLGSRLLLPSVMFKSGEEVFLDDMTRTQAEAALQIPINIVKSGGYDLLSAILDREAAEEQTTEHGMYEPSMKDLNLSEEGEVLS